MRFAALVLAPLLLGASVGSALLAQETRASAAAKFAKEFAATDTNHDGVWSREELQARITRMGTGAKKIDPVHARRLSDLWFDRADTNKDGKVTQAEAQALLAAMMQRYNAANAAAGAPAGPPQTR